DIIGSAGPSITLNPGQSYTYLIAKYDGPNDLAVAWDISSIVGAPITGTTIDIPQNGPDGKGLSHISLFESAPPSLVPEGASTVVLLGAALTGLSLARQRFGRKK